MIFIREKGIWFAFVEWQGTVMYSIFKDMNAAIKWAWDLRESKV